MSNLIDRDALLVVPHVRKVVEYDESGEFITFHAVSEEDIKNAPAVDAVEVVRCKDCKHYKPQNQGAHRNCTTPYCVRVVAVKVSPDDFCSYGERKDNERKAD